MRRFSVLLSIVVVTLLGILALYAQPAAVAQEATPTAEEMMEGITFEGLAMALKVPLPSVGDLFLERFGLDPGAGFPIETGDPTTALAVVESGELTVRMEGTLTVTRAEEMSAAMGESEAGGDFAAATEEIAAGQEVTLGAGDSALFPPNVAGEVRNASQERAVALVVLVGPPAPEGTPVAGTPAP